VERHRAIVAGIEQMKKEGGFYPHPPISELLEIRPDLRQESFRKEYMGQFSEPEDRVFKKNLFSQPEQPAIPSRLAGVVVKGTPIRHRTGIAMLDSIAALERLEVEDHQEFEKVLIRVFEAGARVELGKPDGKVLWMAMTEALGREPTKAEHIRFLKAMRDAGWVSESFHVHKVRYLQSQIDASQSAENLALRSLLEEHQALIDKLRAKLVEQDSVIGQLAGRSNSKGN
jgi:hypothetical protein